MKVNPQESFNLWSLKAVLYGLNSKDRKKYIIDKEDSLAPFLFVKRKEQTNDQIKEYAKLDATSFITRHLNIDDKTKQTIQSKAKGNETRMFSTSMRVYSPTNSDSKGRMILFEYFKDKYENKSSIDDLIKCNTEIIEFWNPRPSHFKKVIKSYINLMLGEDITEWDNDVIYDDLKNFFRDKDFYNQLTDDTNSYETRFQVVAELLRIVKYMIDNEDVSPENQGKVITWLFLGAFLREDIQEMAFYKALRKEYALRISVSDSPKSGCTDATFITTRELITLEGWDEARIARTVVENDKNLYGVSEESKTEGTPEHWQKHIEHNPETFGYIFSPYEKKTIIGNFSFCGIRIPDDEKELEELKAKIEKGNYFENQFLIENISSLSVKGTHCILYILNLSMNKGEEGKNRVNYDILMENLLKAIRDYAKEKEVYFDCVYTRLFIPEHFSYYSDLGFKNVGELEYTLNNNRIYKLERFPYGLKGHTDIVNELIELYDNAKVSKVVCRPCTEADLSNNNIYNLIYQTDPYIYPAMFDTIGKCRKVLSLIYEKNVDTMFNYSNLYIALKDRDIVGIILWHKGKLSWTNDVVKASFLLNGIETPEYFEDVCERYFSQYNEAEENDTIEIINLCVAEKYRNMGIGKKLLKSFLEWRSEKDIMLYCLENNENAIKLYEGVGFKSKSKTKAYKPIGEFEWAVKYTLEY